MPKETKKSRITTLQQEAYQVSWDYKSGKLTRQARDNMLTEIYGEITEIREGVRP